jgi:hypothetical protein
MAAIRPAPPATHNAARTREADGRVDEVKIDREQEWGSLGF